MRRSALTLAQRAAAARSCTSYPVGWVPTGGESPPGSSGCWSLASAVGAAASTATTSTAWPAAHAWPAGGPTFASSAAATYATASSPPRAAAAAPVPPTAGASAATTTASPFAAPEAQAHTPPPPPPSSADIAENVETVNALFVEARDELEYAAEDAGTVWAGESYETAAAAVAAAADAYARLLESLPPEEAGRVSRGMGMKMQQLQAELEAVDPAGAH